MVFLPSNAYLLMGFIKELSIKIIDLHETVRQRDRKSGHERQPRRYHGIHLNKIIDFMRVC